jgi:hypothetical protein
MIMKQNKTFLWSLLALVLIAALYRIVPNRPLGFAPQIAMALFAGAVIKDKKWAFALPLFSMFISDVLYEVLSQLKLTDIQGFYEGQLTNYILFAGITVMGFLIKRITVLNVIGFSLAAPTLFFIVSNGLFWLAGGANAINVITQQPLARDMSGLMQAYVQGIPFYRGSLLATLCFSVILFGGYYLLAHKNNRLTQA